jgi:hypothetical protein
MPTCPCLSTVPAFWMTASKVIIQDPGFMLELCSSRSVMMQRRRRKLRLLQFLFFLFFSGVHSLLASEAVTTNLGLFSLKILDLYIENSIKRKYFLMKLQSEFF